MALWLCGGGRKTIMQNFFVLKTGVRHTGILLYHVFSGVVLLVILIFFFRSGCSPFADDRKYDFEGIPPFSSPNKTGLLSK